MKPTGKRKRSVQVIHPKDWKAGRLKSLLGSFRRRRILVLGDVGIDRYTIGAVDRISPEAPVPIVRVQDTQLKLGLAANVADNIRTLGGYPLMLGLVGRDHQAGVLKELFRRQKISVKHLVTDGGRQTVLKERIVSERQQLLRVDYESTHDVSARVEGEMARRVVALLSGADALILQDYAKGLVSERLSRLVIGECMKRGLPIAVDPNSKTPVARYTGATFLTPNTKEAEALSGIRIHDDTSLLRVGEKLLDLTRARYVVITRGQDGMAIFPSDTREPVSLIPTWVREVYDVSGAGDTVISVMTLAMASGASMVESAILGNLAAGVEVGKRGTATVTPEEVLEALRFFSKH